MRWKRRRLRRLRSGRARVLAAVTSQGITRLRYVPAVPAAPWDALLHPTLHRPVYPWKKDPAKLVQPTKPSTPSSIRAKSAAAPSGTASAKKSLPVGKANSSSSPHRPKS